MVGEWMMDPIKIPWFRHPGSSWSLVYLVRGGSRPNLTEGSLSAAMGCFVQGYLVDLGWFLVWERIWPEKLRSRRVWGSARGLREFGGGRDGLEAWSSATVHGKVEVRGLRRSGMEEDRSLEVGFGSSYRCLVVDSSYVNERESP
ncbi:hypothetical protein M5K25_012987 [Dendrobium thyrsiflorum]|uniref:Uncharacterized protein n=1 Tax=Dendrobium thyrsiflorum TaxID=117978 RepID=A0ABD0V5M4_DENTH